MNHLLGTLNDHPLILPGFSLNPGQSSLRRESAMEPSRRGSLRPSAASTSILPFPYLAYLHSLLEQGRIREAHNLFEFAKDFVPQDSKIREALAPPRVKASAKRDFNRSAEFRWLDLNSSRYRGKWVALLGDRLVASADSLKELLAQLKAAAPERKPLVHHID